MSLAKKILSFLLITLVVQAALLTVLAFYFFTYKNREISSDMMDSLTVIDREILENVTLQQLLKNNSTRDLIAYQLYEKNKIDQFSFISEIPSDKNCQLTTDGNSICLTQDGKTAYSYLRLKIGNDIVGYLKLTKSNEQGLATHKDFFIASSTVIFTFLVNIAVILLFWFRSLGPGLRKLLGVIDSGELNSSIDIKEFDLIQKNIVSSYEKIKQSENKKLQYEKVMAKQKIAKQVIHDIKSPLASLEFLLRDASSKFEKNEQMIAHQSIERINDILSTLSTSERLSNKQITSPDATDILLKKIIAEKRLEFNTDKKVTINLEHSLPYGIFNSIKKSEFYRIISNLINNSIQAKRDENSNLIVDIDAQLKGNLIIITIIDNGKGIAAENLEKIFEFGTSIGKENGEGIGLSYAREVVEKHQGKISIESNMNQGTMVTIKVPTSLPPKWFKTTLEFSTKNICIVDDDQSIHGTWKKRLSDLNLNSLHFHNEADFSLWIKSSNINDYHFLIDFELINSKLNGLEIIELGRIGSFSTLVTSHYDNPEVQRRATALGVKIAPKHSIGSIPIHLNLSKPIETDIDSILIDDDPLIHSTWEILAKEKNKKVYSYYTINDFMNEASKFRKDISVYVDNNLGENMSGESGSKIIYDNGFTNIILATGLELENLPYWIKAQQGKDCPF